MENKIRLYWNLSLQSLEARIIKATIWSWSFYFIKLNTSSLKGRSGVKGLLQMSKCKLTGDTSPGSRTVLTPNILIFYSWLHLGMRRILREKSTKKWWKFNPNFHTCTVCMYLMISVLFR